MWHAPPVGAMSHPAGRVHVTACTRARCGTIESVSQHEHADISSDLRYDTTYICSASVDVTMAHDHGVSLVAVYAVGDHTRLYMQ